MENDHNQQAQQQATLDQGRARIRSQQMAADLAPFNARSTSDAAIRLMTTYSEMRDNLNEAWNLRESTAQRQHLTYLAQVKFALANGKLDAVIGVLLRHVTAVETRIDETSPPIASKPYEVVAMFAPLNGRSNLSFKQARCQ